jgi:hypothetical protein
LLNKVAPLVGFIPRAAMVEMLPQRQHEGFHLVQFKMGPQPNKAWGANAAIP